MGSTQFKTFEDNKASIDDKIWLLERYLFAKDKKSFFETLVFSSDIFKYMRYSDYLNNPHEYDSKALEKEIVEYLVSINNCLQDEIQFKHWSQQICETEDQSKRKVLMMKLNEKYFGYSFDFIDENASVARLQTSRPETKGQVVSSSAADAKPASGVQTARDNELNFEAKSLFEKWLSLDRANIAEDYQFMNEFRSRLNALHPFYLLKADLLQVFNKGICPLKDTLQSHTFRTRKWLVNSFVNFEAAIVAVLNSDNEKERHNISSLLSEFESYYPLLYMHTLENICRAAKVPPISLWTHILREKLLATEAGKWRGVLESTKALLHDSHPQLLVALGLGLQRKELEMAIAEKQVEKVFELLSDLVSIGFIKDMQTEEAARLSKHLEKKLSAVTGSVPELNYQFSAGQDSDLLKSAVSVIIAKNPSFEIESKFDRYFKHKQFRELCARHRMQAGQEVPNVSDIFSEIELTQIRYEKILEIDSSTPSSISGPSDAKIALRLKNISAVDIYVYEIDMKEYFSQTKRLEVDLSVDVVGFKPQKVINKKYSLPNTLVHVDSFDLSAELSKHGVYLAEIIGEGKSCRALLHIGNVVLIQQKGESVDTFYLIEKTKGIYSGDKAKIEISGKEYTADASGRIFVPVECLLNPEEPTISVGVTTPEGLYCTKSIKSYSGEVLSSLDVIMNSSQLDDNAPISLVVVPSITVDGKKARKEQLANPSVELTYVDRKFTKTVNSIKHAKQLGDLTLEVSDLMPEDTKSLQVIYKATLAVSSTQTKPIELSKCFDIATDMQEDRLLNLYVTDLGEDCLRVEVRGRNGETYPNRRLRVRYTDAFDWTDPLDSKVFLTDEKGRVLIKGVPDVKKVTVELVGESVQVVWNNPRMGFLQSLPSSFVLPLGQDLHLPVPISGTKWSEGFRDCFLTRRYEVNGKDAPVENFGDNVTLVHLHGQSHVKVSGLKVGEYELYFVSEAKPRTISVRQPYEQLPAVQIIELFCRSIANGSPNMIKGVGVQAGSLEIALKASPTCQAKPDCYLLTSEYFLQLATFQQKQVAAMKTGDIEDQSFLYNSIVKGSSLKLSSELQYTLNRRLASAYIGNTLDKPSTILKRKQLKTTKEDVKRDEYLDQAEGNYRSKAYRGFDASRHQATMISKVHFTKFLKNKGGVKKVELQKEGDSELDFVCRVGIEELASDFNQACFVVDWGNYFEVSGTVCLNRERDIEQKRVDLLQAQAPSMISFEQRSIEVLKDYKLTIGDKLKVISTLDDLLQVFKLITGNHAVLEEWSFVAKWSSLQPREQLEVYDKYMSHELNIFLYFKDKEFTEEVIKPHLRSKNKKQIVDYFILGDVESLSEYFNAFSLSSLNELELCLLLTVFKDRDRQSCRNFVMKLKQEVKSGLAKSRFQNLDINRYNLRFDSILNSELKSTAQVQKTDGTKVKRLAKPLNAEYVPQVTDGVNNFNTMGVTNEVIDRGWLLYTPSAEKPSTFWLDYLEFVLDHPDNRGFLSSNWIHVDTNPAECLAMLAVLDLPFEHSISLSSTWISFKQDLFVLSKKFISKESKSEKAAEPAAGNVVISQKFFDKHGVSVQTMNPAEPYSMKVIVMNCNDFDLKGMLIVQVPQGAVPIRESIYTEYFNISLDRFKVVEYKFDFYFSEVVEFKCYPATLIDKMAIVSQAVLSPNIRVEPVQIKDVQQVLEQFDKQSADEISDINLREVYHKLKDREFYDKIIGVLKKRFEFDETVWSFSMFHGDLETMSEFMKFKFQNKAININQFDIFYFKNKLFNVDYFNFREYSPLTNPRVHNISQVKHNIINRDFLNTYYIFLKYFQDKGRFDSKDLVSLSVYTIMQDRVTDAIDVFNKIKEGGIQDGEEMKLQFDYLLCYLKFYTKEFSAIKAVCKKYLLYPILSWRNRFIETLNQIEEYEQLVSPTQSAKTLVSAKTKENDEIVLTAAIGSEGVEVTHKNIRQISISYFEIDLEVLFSTDPALILEDSKKLKTSLVPNLTKTVTVELHTGESPAKLTVPIPGELRSKNLLVRVEHQQASVTLRWFIQTLNIVPIESFGQVKVLDRENRFIPKCYVKCISQTRDSKYQFYKDGYTDLRGNFDYVSLNANKLDSVQNFFILIIHHSTLNWSTLCWSWKISNNCVKKSLNTFVFKCSTCRHWNNMHTNCSSFNTCNNLIFA